MRRPANVPGPIFRAVDPTASRVAVGSDLRFFFRRLCSWAMVFSSKVALALVHVFEMHWVAPQSRIWCTKEIVYTNVKI